MQIVSANRNDRLYQELARQLTAELVGGTYPVGSRLPAERELAAHYAVSRPTVREAIIALEVQGLVEVRIGSGGLCPAYSRQCRHARFQHHRVRTDRGAPAV